MSHHDHAGAIAGGGAQVGKDGGCGGVVKRARRLVREYIGRLGQQCPGDGHALLLPAGKLHGQAAL